MIMENQDSALALHTSTRPDTAMTMGWRGLTAGSQVPLSQQVIRACFAFHLVVMDHRSP